MAEHIERNEVRMEQITHHFNCDYCGEYVGSSTEEWDGYYEQVCRREVQIFIPRHDWFRAKRCLCEACYDSWLIMLSEQLSVLGFRKDG